jgi:hypothetical protein
MKKPRADAKLKILPDVLQEKLFQFLRGNTNEKTVEWLYSNHGIKSSPAALSEFFNWYQRVGWFKQSATIADQLKTEIAKLPRLREDAKTVGQIAQVQFEILAANNRDSKFFLDLQRERREEARLQLEREKFEEVKKTDLEKGLDALQAEIDGDTEALQLFEKLKARVQRAGGAS